uniref:Glycoside hydrolase family 1 n=1 Tax=Halothermothrix orenii (strain H 168 / OCM 544 / DSM 9562) TaxID=373903 RepID=UPI0004F23729|nr:Chain A, Glycoside hydrolase family 1 [Halothermothrix orenii H 168]4PTV_B Chain B, Glycoside hydrolase family 1 [Halothermothrix orenii H 168]4PTW_A Chain A, Glycoside hydrolase family 1 [Halothermothrix orenii H 168]4PTW_B Chain B, Glycoside hydrolase family 1 [Halothermothrix orenii H 168]4PTX_A Chain A, Glycoside hydrolase family 1 [Halothermothrix orenii H 168]4PTX_B Chain B, Glycoside hydrolase family 1 [Halothermothrix orenii H 168]
SMAKIIFPEDFIWGAATSSYQIEGAFNEDGKGESIWDRFSHTPGKIENGDTGDIACDHYHLYREDIELMKEIGIRSYRFSTSWPRILPEGKGRVNQKGLDFYKRLVDNLLKANIRPMITLYHWDLPQALQDKGGWTNRDTAKYFAEYARLMFEEFNGLVDLWVTHNEPWVVAFEGHAFGNHAPGTKDFKTALQVAHHLLLSHGMAVDIFREEDLPGEIGITLNLTPAYPAGDSEKDVKAASLLDDYINAWFLSPVFKGSYPEELHHIYEQNLGAFTTQPGDMDIISRDIDFLGINYYSRMVVRHKPGDNLFNAEVVKMEDRPSTEMGWEIYPQGLYDILVRVNKEYTDKPLYITENGAAFDDKLTEEGKIHDEKRINYLGDHFKQAYKALKDGVPLRGYYVWSLMDNFEWAYGYSKRFGLIYVDYENGNRRFLKDSALWYREVIEKGQVEAN